MERSEDQKTYRSKLAAVIAKFPLKDDFYRYLKKKSKFIQLKVTQFC